MPWKNDKFFNFKRSSSNGITLDGIDNVLIHFGKCCNPIPGDNVIGYISRGRGLIVHRLSCSNLSSLSESNDRIVSVNWDTKKNISFKAKIVNFYGKLFITLLPTENSSTGSVESFSSLNSK